ncbi:hypothetical protein SLEP1_g2874 [Rubroshorea leprosula]|uniref:Uncharacterized protein n=1 Tax=Rubroshorea leprosula TaxID=152421 RepID=A0AAV5HSB0_9ROSI|nr:hypothetical protein SLEP1_g2874 [Rubroshorea leprosula]
MVRTFTGGRPPRNEIDEQEDDHVSEADLNDFRPMPRNLFVGGAEQDHLSETDDERTPTGVNDLKGQQNLLGQPSSKREPGFSKWQWEESLPA